MKKKKKPYNNSYQLKYPIIFSFFRIPKSRIKTQQVCLITLNRLSKLFMSNSWTSKKNYHFKTFIFKRKKYICMQRAQRQNAIIHISYVICTRNTTLIIQFIHLSNFFIIYTKQHPKFTNFSGLFFKTFFFLVFSFSFTFLAS